MAADSSSSLVGWDRVGSFTKGLTPAGDLPDEQAKRAYAEDIRAARREVTAVSGITFSLPDTIEIQTRHHWIDANIETFTRLIDLLEGPLPEQSSSLARLLNTGSMSVTLGFLARNVLGQYDPLLLADAPPAEHALYFVHPNITAAAKTLDVEYDLFRRWIAFHEVTHAAEFAAAPWLPTYLQRQLEEGVETLSSGSLAPEHFASVQTAMTAVEGYAELLMDAAFDADATGLREKLEARRRGGDPLTRLLRRLLGLGVKRRQYERGRAFFETIVNRRGFETARVVWESPEQLPTTEELDDPDAWLARVDI